MGIANHRLGDCRLGDCHLGDCRLGDHRLTPPNFIGENFALRFCDVVQIIFIFLFFFLDTALVFMNFKIDK